MRSLLVILTLVTPTLAHAQSVAEPRSLTATPFVNLSFGTSDDLSSSIGLGGAVGYDFTPNLGIEAEVARTFDVAGDTDFIDWSITNFSVNGVYHFDAVRVTPYATFGLGFERSSIDVEDVLPAGSTSISSGSTTEVAYNFGGGIKYKLADSLLARADLRRFQGNDSAPDYWRLYGGVTIVLRR